MWAIPIPIVQLNTLTTGASISCYHRFDIQPSTMETTESLAFWSSFNVRPRNTFANCKESSRACIQAQDGIHLTFPEHLHRVAATLRAFEVSTHETTRIV
jgi:hypothetical protein